MKTISFVIPCYNEEKRLIKTFEALDRVKLPHGLKLFEVIFVDNGSKDKTFLKLSELAQEGHTVPVSIVSYKKRLNERNAAREGIKHSNTKHNLVLNPNLSNLEKGLERLSEKPKKQKRKPPLVSVIMPVYNAEKYLPQAIESILEQTYKRFEFIIIDDESTDKSLAIAKTYRRRFRSKVTILETGKNLNGGGDMCANLGIERARGKYIARMDADDIAARNRLEKQVEFLERNRRVFLVGSNAYVINKNGRVIGEKIEPTSLSDIYKSYARFHPIIHPSTMLRRIYKGIRFSYQIKYSANNDYYTFFKLLCKGYIFANLEEKLIFYRIHDRNDTFINIKEKFLNTVKIRVNMVTGFDYKLTAKDIGLTIVQAILILSLPESVIKNLYLVTKGIIKPKSLNIPPLLSRFIVRSSV